MTGGLYRFATGISTLSRFVTASKRGRDGCRNSVVCIRRGERCPPPRPAPAEARGRGHATRTRARACHPFVLLDTVTL